MASKTGKTPGHSRSTSAVIPAIPRIFENPTLTAASSASTASRKSPPSKAPENSGKSIAGSAEHEKIETLEGREHDSIPVAAAENEASSTPKQATAYIGQEVPSAQNPRVILPRNTEYQPSLVFPPVDGFNQSKQGKVASRDTGATSKETDRRLAVQKIAFGSFNNQSESSESSPTLSPSATSTHYTQPTPTSETRSQASKSEHEQDGRVGTQDNSHRISPDGEVGLVTRLVGPYPPGLIGHHVANFAKYQRHFVMQYVHDLFRRNDGNFTLDVVFKSGTVRYNLHSTILSQSPMFAKAIQRGVETREFSTDGRLYMAITVQDNFVTASAIEIVLKSLYGIAALDIKALSQPYLNPHFFYSLFAASCLLAVPNYQILTSNCIVEMLDWRLLTETFRLCLTGQNFSATRDPYPRRTDELVASIFQPQASMIFERAISLLVQELNAPDFHFEKSSLNAPTLGGFPRSDTAPKNSEHHSKNEAGIVFGNMDSRATEKNRALSCILLSLPLLVLQRVLVELDSKNAAKIIKPVITERQQRRELWARIKGDDEIALVKELHIPVDVLPNGLGLINEIS